MSRFGSSWIVASLAALLLVVGAAPRDSRAATYKSIHNFCSRTKCDDGGFPSSIFADSAGNLYGTAEYGSANSGGVVFALIQPPAGHTSWTEPVLDRLCTYPIKPGVCQRGAQPVGVTPDSSGNLFVVASNGGIQNGGTIFKLSPPPVGQALWAATPIYKFTGDPGGLHPNGGLVIDSQGNLYGTTQQGGASNVGLVFELSPPTAGQTAWTFQELYSFCNCAGGNRPLAGLLMDSAGNLYGTTSTPNVFEKLTGTVFELSPPSAGQSAWSFHLLYSFCRFSGCRDGAGPEAALIMDGAGNLYGTTLFGGVAQTAANNQGGGTVFELSPPSPGSTSWRELVLHSFCSLPNCADGELPAASLLFDASGNLYGSTTSGGYAISNSEGPATGTVFKLSRPSAGSSQWAEIILHRFCALSICDLGGSPLGLTYKGASSGAPYDGISPLYGIARSGGVHGTGTVFQIVP